MSDKLSGNGQGTNLQTSPPATGLPASAAQPLLPRGIASVPLSPVLRHALLGVISLVLGHGWCVFLGAVQLMLMGSPG